MKKLFTLSILLFCTGIHSFAQRSQINKGNQLYLEAQYDLAEQQYRKALEADPANETAQYNLASTLHKQKRYDDAIEAWNQFTAHTRNKALKASAFYNKGVAYTKQKDLAASIEAYKEALRLNPEDKEARDNLQKALQEQKKQEEEKKNQQKQNQRQPKMSQKEAEQKLQLLSQKEKELQQRLQGQSRQSGNGQGQDW